MKRVMVGMSGGVDSSVTAYLLKQQGYEVIGATMRLYGNELPGIARRSCSSRTCCSLDDVEDAKSVARRLGIAHYALDFTSRFEDAVIRPFVRSYEQARTPNPCIDCNRRLKFESMLERALELGCDYVATGHYAQIGERGGRFFLHRGADASKDQSYVLYSLTQQQLAHTLLPLGALSKSEVRAIAAEQGFVNAEKPESQDICFVPDGDYAGFLERYSGHGLRSGEIRDEEGRVLGRHAGIESFTVGQRKGIGIAAAEPLYVLRKDAQDAALIVGPKASLESRGCIAEDWNWIADPEALSAGEGCGRLASFGQEDGLPAEGFAIPDGAKDGPAMPEAGDAFFPGAPLVMVKTHYRQTPHAARLSVGPKGSVRVDYAEPSRIAAPGQAVVAYIGDEVVGGGTVASSF